MMICGVSNVNILTKSSNQILILLIYSLKKFKLSKLKIKAIVNFYYCNEFTKLD